MKRLVSLGFAFAIAFLAPALLVAATATDPVPEIDAGLVAAGLGILTAGVLILRSRRSG